MVVEASTTSTTSAREGISPGWVRAGGALGLLAVVLLVGAAVAFGSGNALTSSATPAAISNYLSSHGGSVLATTIFSVLGAAVGLWFLAIVARILHDRDVNSHFGLVALRSGAVATAISAFDGVTLSALVYLQRQGGPTNPSVTRIFFDLQNGLVMPGLFGFFVAGALIAMGIAMTRGHLAKRWVGWLAIVLAILACAGAILGLSSVSGGTSILGYSPAIGYGIFVLITSFYLLREGSRPRGR